MIDRFLPSFYLPLVTEMLIMGLFAMGFDLLMGYTGMVSFGHAAFFGMGAYVTGLTMLRFGLPVLPAMLLGILGATVAAAVIGFFAIRLKSVYFALLTFAFSQIFYQIAITWTSLHRRLRRRRALDADADRPAEPARPRDAVLLRAGARAALPTCSPAASCSRPSARCC